MARRRRRMSKLDEYNFGGDPTGYHQHQIRIARDTLRMPKAMRGVMGGPSLTEAKNILRNYNLRPGGAKTIGGGAGGPIRVRAHMRKGMPVRESMRHLGPTAKNFLNFYRASFASDRKFGLPTAQARRSAAGGTRGYMYDSLGWPQKKKWVGGKRVRGNPVTRKPFGSMRRK